MSTSLQQNTEFHDGGTDTQELHLALRFLPNLKIHIRLTFLTTSLLIFMTSSETAIPGASSALGSFVYSMPNVRISSVQFRPLKNGFRPQTIFIASSHSSLFSRALVYPAFYC